MANRIQLPIAASLACALALVPLVLAAYALAPVEHLDVSLLVRISDHVPPIAKTRADAIAGLADPLPLLAMTAIVCGAALAVGRRREALAAAAVVAGANVTTQALKLVLAHPRYQPFPGHSHPWPTAFPSGHATAAASIAIALVLVAPPRLRLPAALAGATFAGLVGVSVVALEWHFPSDVIGALLVAGGWGFAALAALRLGAVRPRPPASRAGPQTVSRAAISTK
jgi:membrane-associated phospholipid phosphatase